MPKFRVVSGVHYEPRSAEYVAEKGLPANHPDLKERKKKGDVFESSRPLDEIFPNKFERIVDGLGGAPVSDARKKAVSQLIASGSWGESDRINLEQLSDKGFDTIIAAAGMDAPESESESAVVDTSILGTDVTEEFDVDKTMFQVFRSASRRHNVVKVGESKPLNPSPLNKGQVEQFIQDYLKETQGQ